MSTVSRRRRSRRRRVFNRLLSLVLLAAGALLLFRGGHELWDAVHGQAEAARELELPLPVAQAAPSAETRLPLGTTVAKLTFPRLDESLFVVEGVDQADLRRGPGHLPGSALPGDDGNVVVAGHRDTHFRLLKDIRKGDDIVLETRTGLFLYRVKKMSIVTPQNTASIQPSSSAVLHLITCYPFYYVGAAPKRYIVEAGLAATLNASLTGTPHS